jgi:hypothetical protein
VRQCQQRVNVPLSMHARCVCFQTMRAAISSTSLNTRPAIQTPSLNHHHMQIITAITLIPCQPCAIKTARFGSLRGCLQCQLLSKTTTSTSDVQPQHAGSHCCRTELQFDASQWNARLIHVKTSDWMKLCCTAVHLLISPTSIHSVARPAGAHSAETEEKASAMSPRRRSV